MKGMNRKDQPWMLATALAGAIGLALTAADKGFLELFVLGPGQLEELYFATGAAGLFVGAAAVLWDDLLGTREFLQQRPISSRVFAMAPLRAVGRVLSCWMVAVPLLAWVLASAYSGLFQPTFWVGLPQILATLMVAWPAAAIGCVAAAMPLPWWLRLVTATTLTLTCGTMLHTWTESAGGRHGIWPFVLLCVAITVVLAPLAAHCRSVRMDRDRALPPVTRMVVGLLLVVSCAYSMGAIAGETQANVLQSLHREYPAFARHEGRMVLVNRVVGDWKQRVEVDAEHAPVASPRSRDDFEERFVRMPATGRVFDMDVPRWHRRGRRGGLHGWRDSVLIDHCGRAWLYEGLTGRLAPTGRGAALQPFPAECHIEQIHSLGGESFVTIVGDRESGQVWRFDGSLGHFVELPLPDGDRYVGTSGMELERLPSDVASLPMLASFFEKQERLEYVLGQNGRYALSEQGLITIGDNQPRHATNVAESQRIGTDPITFVIDMPAQGGLPALRHEYTPHTFWEHVHAAHAMAWSLLRPPLLQVSSNLFANDATRASVGVDLLLIDGRRRLLLLGCLLVGVFSAWCARQRLMRLGASKVAQAFWTSASLCIGPLGVLLSCLCEPRRAYRRPTLSAPVAPRIASLPHSREVSA